MKQFIIGKDYFCRSACDHECKWTFKVISRTAQTITLHNSAQGTIKKKVKIWNDVETVLPLGSYSMAPILTAEKTA